jgi:hypothetical protein
VSAPKSDPRPTPRRRLECCRPWDDLPADERATWKWQVLHQLGHSRVAFSPGHYAGVARITELEAKALIDRAYHRKWLFHTDIPGLWVGRLSAKGR